MRMLSRLLVLTTTAVLAACTAGTVSLPPDAAPVVACGNGHVEANEGCDDGNAASGDGCDVNCRPTACGNGVATMNEGCDDGNAVSGDGCDNNCTATACGNGILTADEVCDDGNTADGDGCDRNCTVTACGNGVVTADEVCDDGNAADGDGCDNNCTATACGNGILTADESCDDGNAADGDGCDRNCTVTACGNGVVTAGEVCDDGNLANDDGCDDDCTVSALVYVKASNTGASDRFGRSIALSANGSTMAVGVPSERSGATGIDGDQTDNLSPGAGAVYVFTRSGATWVQQAYVKASNTGAVDHFGWDVALSADGSTLAVSAWMEDSAATGIGGDQADDSAQDAGAVYVFD